jgi:hypothetical protein
MYKWFLLKEKFFSHLFLFPNFQNIMILCSDFFYQFQIQNLGVTLGVFGCIGIWKGFRDI